MSDEDIACEGLWHLRYYQKTIYDNFFSNHKTLHVELWADYIPSQYQNAHSFYFSGCQMYADNERFAEWLIKETVRFYAEAQSGLLMDRINGYACGSDYRDSSQGRRLQPPVGYLRTKW